MIDKSKVNKELQDKLVPKFQEILEILKQYPEPFCSTLMSASFSGRDGYINFTMLANSADKDDDEDIVYLLDYCSYEEEN